MPSRAPGVHTHEEWKGMAQPVGLVVEPVVLNRHGIFPESATTVLADWQQRLELLLEEQPIGEQWLSVAPSFALFCQEVLRPDGIVPDPSQGDGPPKAQLLVQELRLGSPFDALPPSRRGRVSAGHRSCLGPFRQCPRISLTTPPGFRKDVTPLHSYIRGLEDMTNASLQRGRQG